MQPTLSIVVPAFNEAARIGPSLRKIVDYVDGLGLAQVGNAETEFFYC